MKWNSPALRTLIQLALKEDAARQDITTLALIPSKLKIEAQIRAKERGVSCGMPLAKAFFKSLDPACQFVARAREGQSVKSGDILASVRGSARSILSGERSALNAVQHLSGIATFTQAQVRRLRSKRTGLYDTRKTLPGWRELEKYAVACGGGRNHRMSLKTGVLIKDNHLQLCRLLGRDWISAIGDLRRKSPSLKIELEVQSRRDLADAIRLVPDQVLLDNITPIRLKSFMREVRQSLPGAEIEVSGGVRSDQVSRLSRLGVERISMGRLTHSAPAFDCALDITRVFHSR